MAKSNTNSLLNFFSIGVKSQNNQQIPVPKVPVMKSADSDKDTLAIVKKLSDVPMDAQYKKIFSYYLNDIANNRQDISNRMDRYKDLQFAYDNSSVIKKTVENYGFEVPQADSQTNVIEINTKDKKFTQFIADLFDRLEITADKIKNITEDLVLFGDSPVITPIDEKMGILDFIVESPLELVERYEFQATKEQRKMDNVEISNLYANANQNQIFQDLTKILSGDLETKNNLAYFSRYLFGFNISNRPVAPWEAIHFRLDPFHSEFYPYGRSKFITATADFMKLQTAETLSMVLKHSAFPKNIYNVKTERRTPTDAWNAVATAQEEFSNLNNQSGSKEDMPLNSEYWLPKDYIEYDTKNSDIDLTEVWNEEYLRENLVLGLNVPPSQYLPNEAGDFGNSGISLVQQYKPFARDVYTLQSIILNGLIQLVKVHCLITGKFIDQPFELTMNFPATEDSSDRLDIKSDTLNLVKDILSSFGEALGLDRGESLPIDIVQDVFMKYSFLADDEIQTWVKSYLKSKEENLEEKSKKKIRLLEKKIYSIEESIILNEYFKHIKEKRKYDFAKYGKHFVSSFKYNRDYERIKEYYNIKKGLVKLYS